MQTTIESAKRIMEMITPELGKKAVILALSGPLGAGKTALTKELAKLLEIKENITSPTFVLNTQYSIPNTQCQLEHLDVWRLETWDEVERLGLQKMIEEASLIVIEWADKFKEDIKRLSNEAIKLIWVEISYPSLGLAQAQDGEEREIKIS